MCPKYGMQALGPKGFWGTSKPYCSFCGWNVERAKEVERTSLKQMPWSLGFFAACFGTFAYFSRQGFTLAPLVFLSAIIIADAIISWRRLKILNESHPTLAYATAVSSVAEAEEETKQVVVSH